jgi:ABC-type glycerol-3-phosphate transport system substrate-binding protein
MGPKGIESVNKQPTDLDSLQELWQSGRISRQGFVRAAMRLGLSLAAAEALAMGAGGGALEAATKSGEARSEQKFKGQTLNLLYFAATYAVGAQMVIPEFQKMTGATVRLAQSPYLSLFTKELTSLVSGAGDFDVMQVAYQWDGQFSPYLEDLAPYLQRDKSVNMQDFIPAVAAVTGTWGGRRHGIPNACDAYGIIYRTDIFQKHGIKANAQWTWDEYLRLAKELTGGGMHGTSICGQADKEQADSFWTARYWSLGGHLLTRDWKPLPQRQAAVKAVEMVKSALKYAPRGVLSYSISDENNAFVTGKVAMAELWPSLIRGTANNPKQSKVVGLWNLLPYPGHHPQLSAWSVAIPRSAKNKALAWEWLKFYTSTQKQLLFLNKVGVGPTRTALYTQPAVVKQHPDFPTHLISLKGARARFRFAASQQAFNFLDDQLMLAYGGSSSPSSVIGAVASEWQKVVTDHHPAGQYTDDYA